MKIKEYNDLIKNVEVQKESDITYEKLKMIKENDD